MAIMSIIISNITPPIIPNLMHLLRLALFKSTFKSLNSWSEEVFADVSRLLFAVLVYSDI